MALFHHRTIRGLVLAIIVLLVLTGGLVLAGGSADDDRTDAATTRAHGALAVDDEATATTAGDDATTTPVTAGAAADPGGSATTGSDAIDPDDDGDFPGLPEDDEDPGPWVPPTPPGLGGFTTPPIVLDLVAPTSPPDPDLDGGKGQAGSGFSTGVVQCDGNCIEHATVEPHGTSATFRVHTTVKARIWVVIDSPAVQDSSARVRDYEATFDDLTPDTRYNVTLVAEDVHGNLEHRYGHFDTLRRRVTIEFTSIDVVDDADHWGKGEVEWFFKVDGGWIPDFHRGIAKVKSGNAIHLDDRRLVLNDHGPLLTLGVQGVEHDPKGFCEAGIPPYSNSGGDIDGCRDYATATEVFDLDDLAALPVPPVPNGGHDAVFMLRTRAYYLEFDAYGTIDVDYV